MKWPRFKIHNSQKTPKDTKIESAMLTVSVAQSGYNPHVILKTEKPWVLTAEKPWVAVSKNAV